MTILVGGLVEDLDTALAFSFINFLPLQRGASLAASTDTWPGWLRTGRGNPVTHVMDACRALLGGTPVGDSIISTLMWCAVLVAIFCPLAVRAYGRQQ